jgi:hypothetical protein
LLLTMVSIETPVPTIPRCWYPQQAPKSPRSCVKHCALIHTHWFEPQWRSLNQARYCNESIHAQSQLLRHITLPTYYLEYAQIHCPHSKPNAIHSTPIGEVFEVLASLLSRVWSFSTSDTFFAISFKQIQLLS